ncbi:MAG: spermidine synthase [bacterium]|nr:spermidine synthase [bacterium]
MTTIMCMIFFLSGASALIFELVWFQLAGLTFGNSIFAAAIVMAGFMGGLAAGSTFTAFRGHKIKSPIKFYVLLEIIIGVSGFALVLVLPVLSKLLVPIYEGLVEFPFIFNLFKMMVAFLLMFVPTCAMGATLPVLVKALHEKKPGFGRVLGILYGWNTFGATAGVLVGEFFLVEYFGLRGTGLLAAVFNIIAAFVAYALYKRVSTPAAGSDCPVVGDAVNESPPSDSEDRLSLSLNPGRLLTAGFLSGFTLLALEVVWFRFMLLFFSSTTRNFSIMLAMVLVGIALGGIIASKWYRHRPDAHRFLIPVILINGIIVILTYTNFVYIFHLLESISNDAIIALLSLFLIFPVSLLSGIIFTMLGKALHIRIMSETKATGLLVLTNTVGAMLGSLLSGLVLIPFIGIEKSFFICALLYGVIAILVLAKKRTLFKKKLSFSLASTVTFLLCLLIFPFGFMMVHYMKIPYERHSTNGEKRVYLREGVTETIQYLQKDLLNKPYYQRLITNSHSMSSTTYTSHRYMKFFVYWPTAVHKNLKNALLICYGCGLTAKALTDTQSLERIDIVDISRDIVEQSRVVFPDPKENPAENPRVNIHIEDGRFYLLSTKRTFDLITAEPPPPNSKGIVNLYTQEYFQLIRNRLSEGGIVTYWLPVYQMSAAESKSIVKGFSNVFPECSLWKASGYEWVMIGLKNPGPTVTAEEFRRQWNDPVVGDDIRNLGFQCPEQFGAFFIADGKRLHDWLDGCLPLTDNFPKRLTSTTSNHPMESYRALLAPGASQKNFIDSNYIAKIWPETIRKKTCDYFEAADFVNELACPEKWRRHLGKFTYLHQCLHNPLLENYLLRIFNSNGFAQNIIRRARIEFPNRPVAGSDTFLHLAAEALQNKDFLKAEHFLHLMIKSNARTGSLDDFAIFDYCTSRMYLLYYGGNKTKALAVKKQFLDHVGNKVVKSKKQKLTKEMAAFSQWLDSISMENNKD